MNEMKDVLELSSSCSYGKIHPKKKKVVVTVKKKYSASTRRFSKQLFST